MFYYALKIATKQLLFLINKFDSYSAIALRKIKKISYYVKICNCNLNIVSIVEIIMFIRVKD